MRIGFWSNPPMVGTGYGVQSALFGPELQRLGHQVVYLANAGLYGAQLSHAGIPVMPVGPETVLSLGQDLLAAHNEVHALDVVITLADIWPLMPEAWPSVRWCPWFPIDHQPLGPKLAERARKAWQPIVFSRHAEAECKAQGIYPAYVPHGVDLATFCPGDKAEARDKLGIPRDAYVVGMVAANKGWPSRKAFPEQLEAFRRFKSTCPEALLYLHTTTGENAEHGGINLPYLCETIGLRVDHDVVFGPQYHQWVGMPPTVVAEMYRAFDVLLSVTMGEGFGVPILEAQATGCPVIIGDWTAMSELCFGGFKVEQDQAHPFWVPYGGFQYLPRPAAVANRLKQSYRSSGDARVRQNAIEGAAAFCHHAVADQYWAPLLDLMVERLSEDDAA